MPGPPPAAGRLFGDRLGLAVRYAELLAGPGISGGLVGPREAPRLWDRHLLNCAVVAPLLPPACRVVDMGSGAGLPGIVLALVRTDLRVILVEPMQRRTVFLEDCVTALGLDSTVSVRRTRAEALHGVLTADVVIARALAPLARLVDLCWPLVGPDGRLVAMKGARAGAEVRRDRARLPSDGELSIQVCGAGALDPPTTVVVLQRLPASARAPGSRHAR